MKRVVKAEELDQIWDTYHDSMLGGMHSGRTSTINKIQEHYYIPKIAQWVTERIQNCLNCRQTLTVKHVSPIIPIRSHEPFERIQVDFMGPFSEDKDTGSLLFLLFI